MLKRFIALILTISTFGTVGFASADVGFSANLETPSDIESPTEIETPSDIETPIEIPDNGYFYQDGRWTFYKDSEPSSKFGIDVSVWNDKLDWEKIKADGVEFVMLRVGFRGYGKAGNMKIDSRFEENIKGANAVGLDIGCYFFSQSITVEEAVEEAKQTIEWIEPYREYITYPVAYDTEYYSIDDARTNLANLDKRTRTDMALAFVRTIRENGYTPAVYSNTQWLTNKHYKDEIVNECDIWLAQWSSSKVPTFSDFQMWQFSDKGEMTGHSCFFDYNLSLYDYSKLDYTVTYDANGGIGEMDLQQCKRGSEYTVQSNLFTKGNIEFLGWKAVRLSDNKSCYTDKDGNFVWANSATDDLSEYIFKEDEVFSNLTAVKNDVITFKAVWENGNSDFVLYDVNGDGSVSVADVRSLILSITRNDIPTEKFNICDINGDGRVSVADARKLLLYVAKNA